MKVVIDTNVFVSATLVAQGPSAQIIDAWKEAERYQLIVSPAILEELREVLFYPRIERSAPGQRRKWSNSFKRWSG